MQKSSVLIRYISLLLLLLTVFSLMTGCGRAAASPTEESITVIPSEKAEYTEEEKRQMSDTLTSALDEQIRAVYGNNIPDVLVGFSDIISSIVNSLEFREISLSNAEKSIQLIAANKELIRSVILSVKDNLPVSTDNLFSLFSTVVEIIGVEKSTMVIYDITVAYCSHMTDKYTSLYMKNPSFTYLFDYAVAWQRYCEEIKKIGEESFASLLRVGVSTSALMPSDETAADYIGSLSDGEIALLLRSEGDMLSNLSLEDSSIEFILEVLAENRVLNVFHAMLRTSDTERWCKLWREFAPRLTEMLSTCNKELVSEIKAGKTSTILYRLFEDYTYEDYERLTDILESENEEKYQSYFKKQNKYNDYLRYKEAVEEVKIEELLISDADGFENVLSEYLKYSCPALSFAVFEL